MLLRLTDAILTPVLLLTDAALAWFGRLSRSPLLYLNECNLAHARVTDFGLQRLTQGCPGIQKLTLAHCVIVTDAGVCAMVNNLSGLQQLFMNRCWGKTIHALCTHGQLGIPVCLCIEYTAVTIPGIDHRVGCSLQVSRMWESNT